MLNKIVSLILITSIYSSACANFTAKEREQMNKDAQRSDLRDYECIGAKHSDGTFESLDDLRKKERNNISKILKLRCEYQIKHIKDAATKEEAEKFFAKQIAELDYFSIDPNCEHADTKKEIAYWKNELNKAYALKVYPAWLISIRTFLGYSS